MKTGMTAGCDEIRPETVKTLKRVLWLIHVSSGMVFWKDTERLD